ncbi:hypothetical protein Q4610_17235 [Sphingobium sp. HBC34]|uniref:Uncharacterized protein n=1 Tax=Sphingobium cyanobacteriorum TaxID=3063954 RepID=A0ABT8ZQH1_9SPHN|nr:hypothetical protein [Sphingobium sp. HBC34]MDO7836794.1 hypothetical protein [Sphingobium sp. HBC34]
MDANLLDKGGETALLVPPGLLCDSRMSGNMPSAFADGGWLYGDDDRLAGPLPAHAAHFPIIQSKERCE